ncbi:MAG: hypothetical protein GWN99_19025 [Gemmatimonadetes bacterium]|uniref:Pilus assembly protein PilP n=1 Tax=Candidatus Kutchimonas denitrificans TaxID=3056748 RepID=A0AAE5CAV4_9BACT|nr:hypothetical protein [Gemmatimonadota bacterium]NIR73758.1 hypothetical protein [Candidatus Kutchimonas denitrificans]NIS03122.1 hypothetical protein [Gemmatimonadota bacterium]NIT69023.1 hypothetical protein [Gemmatimonadota bacterium]NIU54114.1 hypothetical protein [Gemmatimonadota bacterium]
MVSAALTLVALLASLVGAPPAGSPALQDTSQAQPGSQSPLLEVYRRETFVYPTDSRRNPFVNLIEEDTGGPIFENLDLTGIIFGGSAGSVASLVDRATEKSYRVRRGDIVGNARVVEIRPDAVVFQVTQFGVTRSETLRIRREEEEQG